MALHKSGLQFLIVAALLASTAVFLQSRKSIEKLPNRAPISSFPAKLDAWQGKDFDIQPEVLKLLGAGEFLSRVYLRGREEPYIDLFLAYFPSQRTGDTIHSPQNCLPGAGWSPVQFNRIELPQADGKKVTINRYIIAKGIERQVVLYWYQAHGRVVASEYWAKIFLVLDAIRLNRTDGALVRLVTPVDRNGGVQAAESRALEFARQLTPTLDGFIPP